MESRVNWLLLGNMMLVSFLIGISHRIFAISLPTIARSLETDIVGISWALISFQLSTISLSLVFGRIGDLHGRQSVLTAGLWIFTISSFLCGIAQDILQLVLFRLLQGIGAAMVQAQGRVLAMEAAPQSWAGKTQGFMTTAHHSGFLFGPSLGGLIIDYIHWRGVFFFLVPLGAAGVVLTWISKKSAKSGNTPPTPPRAAIDYPGASLLVLATVALIALLDRRFMEILSRGWQIALVAAFVSLFAGFIFREAAAASPLLELSLFRIRLFAFSTICLLLMTITQSLTGFLLPFYFQEILRLSPTFMGLLFMSMPIFSVTLSPVGGFLSDKVGPRLPATAGVFFFGAAALLGAFLRTDSQWILPTVMLALGGLGTGFFYPPNHTAMISSVPQEYRGVASGSLYMMFGLGNILGITLGSFLMTASFRFHSGLPEATAAEPAAFVAALNTTFLAAVAFSLIAAFCSLSRGNKATEAAALSS
ncbi:MFS transporter [bacterium]|nr:MAG: MFS transporter [bacterium]